MPVLDAVPVSAPIPENSPFAVDPAYSDPSGGAAPLLPANVPVPSQRPGSSFGVANAAGVSGLAGYASDRLAATAYAEERAYGSILTKDAISSAWKRREAEEHGEYVEIGTFNTLEEAKQVQASLPGSTRFMLTKIPTETSELYELTAVAEKGGNDALLRAAWKVGAENAFVVRLD